MKFSFKKFLVLFATVVLVAVTFWLLSKSGDFSTRSPSVARRQSIIVQIGDTKIPLEVVKTQEALTKGLSGRTSLDPNSGMLFVMPKRGIYGFWMKDMLFPIDIIWIAENKIVAIDNSVPLEPNGTNLKTYSPPETVDYVLEVNAGFAVKHHFENGTAVILP